MIAGHDWQRAAGSVCLALVFIAFPPLAYHGFELMHDEFGSGKPWNYTWLLVPLGILAAGIAYASSEGRSCPVASRLRPSVLWWRVVKRVTPLDDPSMLSRECRCALTRASGVCRHEGYCAILDAVLWSHDLLPLVLRLDGHAFPRLPGGHDQVEASVNPQFCFVTSVIILFHVPPCHRLQFPNQYTNAQCS